jgi:hypothetical protein
MSARRILAGLPRGPSAEKRINPVGRYARAGQYLPNRWAASTMGAKFCGKVPE